MWGLSHLLCHMYKINPILCGACFLLYSTHVFTVNTQFSLWLPMYLLLINYLLKLSIYLNCYYVLVPT